MDEKKRRKWKKKNRSHHDASKASQLAQGHSNSSSSRQEDENESNHQRGLLEGMPEARRACGNGGNGEGLRANVIQGLGDGECHDGASSRRSNGRGLSDGIAEAQNGGGGEGGRVNVTQEFGDGDDVSSKRSNSGGDGPVCEACGEYLASMARFKAELDVKDQALRNLVGALAAGPETGHDVTQATVTDYVEYLRAYIAQLRKRESTQKIIEDTLRGEIQELKGDVLELRAMQEQREAVVQTEEVVREENLQLREESLHLQKEVEETKDINKKLLLERQQLMLKMKSIQTGMHQPKQEATVNAQVCDELAGMATTPESSKGLLSQTSINDSVGFVAAVPEDSAIQTAAAAAMVEKLVTENAALVEKVNEQSAFIERLSQNYSYAMQMQENGYLGAHRFGKIDSGMGFSENDVELHSTNPQGVVEPTLQAPSEEAAGESQGEREEPNIAISTEFTSMTDSAIQVHANALSLASNATSFVIRDDSDHQFVSTQSSKGLELAPHLIRSQSKQQDDLMTPLEAKPFSDADSKHQFLSAQSSESAELAAHDVSSQSKQQDAFTTLEVKPFSDAPIMGAPIRLFSFLAKYVSGADLVKVKGPS